MTAVYLSQSTVVTTYLAIGVWTLIALAIGIAVGKVIERGDAQAAIADDSTWLDDQPDGRTDTVELYVPRDWWA